jgi:hypothetical protein
MGCRYRTVCEALGNIQLDSGIVASVLDRESQIIGSDRPVARPAERPSAQTAAPKTDRQDSSCMKTALAAL